MSASIGFVNGILSSAINMRMSHNLGFKYSSSIFTICSSDGRDLSINNPAFITLPSKTNSGLFKTIRVGSNSSFEDSTGTSDIVNNLFGVTTGFATANCPFSVYAVLNDDEDNVEFMLSRLPNTNISPPAANIGAPDDAVADLQSDFWCLNSIDETLYDGNPCLCVGSISMTKDTGDDWTVGGFWPNAISVDVGVDKTGDGKDYVINSAEFGAGTGSHFIDNGGTAPTGGGVYLYRINWRRQTVLVNYASDAFTAAGIGAVSAKLVLPYIIGPNSLTTYQYTAPNGTFFDTSAGTYIPLSVSIPNSQKEAQFIQSGATASMLNTDLQVGDRLFASFEYSISVNE